MMLLDLNRGFPNSSLTGSPLTLLHRLVDEITYKKASEAADVATQSAILGPFFRQDHPVREKGATISFDTPADAQVVYMYGTVTDAKTKKPIPNATIDVWQASTNGMYEQQDDKQVDHNLRGKFVTDENGEYAWYCLRPTPYPIPFDGPAGKLLQLLDRHPYRPAHIHLVVSSTLHGYYATSLIFYRFLMRATSQLLHRFSTRIATI